MHGNPYCMPILLLLYPHTSIRGQTHIKKGCFKLPAIGLYCLVMEMAMVELYDRFSITLCSKPTCCIYHQVYIVLTWYGYSNGKAMATNVCSCLEPYLCPSTQKDPLCLLRWLSLPLNLLLWLRLPEHLVQKYLVSFKDLGSVLSRGAQMTSLISASTWSKAGARSPTRDSCAAGIRLPRTNVDFYIIVLPLIQWEEKIFLEV